MNFACFIVISVGVKRAFFRGLIFVAWLKSAKILALRKITAVECVCVEESIDYNVLINVNSYTGEGATLEEQCRLSFPPTKGMPSLTLVRVSEAWFTI